MNCVIKVSKTLNMLCVIIYKHSICCVYYTLYKSVRLIKYKSATSNKDNTVFYKVFITENIKNFLQKSNLVYLYKEQ